MKTITKIKPKIQIHISPKKKKKIKKKKNRRKKETHLIH